MKTSFSTSNPAAAYSYLNHLITNCTNDDSIAEASLVNVRNIIDVVDRNKLFRQLSIDLNPDVYSDKNDSIIAHIKLSVFFIVDSKENYDLIDIKLPRHISGFFDEFTPEKVDVNPVKTGRYNKFVFGSPIDTTIKFDDISLDVEFKIDETLADGKIELSMSAGEKGVSCTFQLGEDKYRGWQYHAKHLGGLELTAVPVQIDLNEEVHRFIQDKVRELKEDLIQYTLNYKRNPKVTVSVHQTTVKDVVVQFFHTQSIVPTLSEIKPPSCGGRGVQL